MQASRKGKANERIVLTLDKFIQLNQFRNPDGDKLIIRAGALRWHNASIMLIVGFIVFRSSVSFKHILILNRGV